LWESGTDLLSRGIPRTIIGAAPFHGPVRDDGRRGFDPYLAARAAPFFTLIPEYRTRTSTERCLLGFRPSLRYGVEEADTLE